MANRRHPSHPRHNVTDDRERLRAQRQSAALVNQELRTHPPGAPRRKRVSLFWRRLRFFICLLILIGGGYLTFIALTAPEFRVAAVTVSGAGITSDGDIIRAQKKLIGQNWILAKADATQKTLAGVATVKEVTVTRALHWPPQMHIHIEERTPFACVGAGENWWVVDENGIPFRRAGQGDENVFALTGPKLVPVLGTPLPKQQWQSGARLVRALRTPGQNWALRRIYFDKNGFASLRLQGGMHDELLVRLGGDRWEEKLQRTQLALEYFERTGQRATSLNLVSYNMPQWTPLRSAHAESTPPNHSSPSGA